MATSRPSLVSKSHSQARVSRLVPLVSDAAINTNLLLAPTFTLMARRAPLEALLEAGARQPIPEVLFVEAGLASAGLVRSSRPVARRVGCKGLVDEDDMLRAVRVLHKAELELGVGEDDAAGSSVVGGGLVQGDGGAGDAVVEVLADEGGG